ncbi:MAG: hypothetical protein EBZ48_15845 [Proteobacteria bacterium]|nr:hypothetical protein [Pseudomonadota bacterium]
MLESTKSKVAVVAVTGIEMETYANEAPILIRTLSGKVSVQGAGGMELASQGDIDIHNPGGDIKASCANIYLNPVDKMQVKKHGLVIEDGTVKMSKVEALQIKCKGPVTSRTMTTGNISANSAATRSGRVGKNPTGVDLQPIEGIESPKLSNDSEIEYIKSTLVSDLPLSVERLPKWNMFDKQSWIRSNERLMRTYTQEMLADSLTEEEESLYGTWDLSEAVLLKRDPWAGEHAYSWGSWMKQSKSQSQLPPLNQDASQSGEDLLMKSAFVDEDIVFKYLKPNP